MFCDLAGKDVIWLAIRSCGDDNFGRVLATSVNDRDTLGHGMLKKNHHGVRPVDGLN